MILLVKQFNKTGLSKTRQKNSANKNDKNKTLKFIIVSYCKFYRHNKFRFDKHVPTNIFGGLFCT